MNKLKRYEHFSTQIGEGLVCLDEDVEKLEVENERLKAELHATQSTLEESIHKELKPCPFCGGAADVKFLEGPYFGFDPSDHSFYAECDGCGATTESVDSDDLAIKAWSTRHREVKE